MRTLPLLVLLGVAAMPAAEADLDASIARHRMGTLVIKTAPGARVGVEQVRHEFWFGSTLPTHVFSGQLAAEEAARFKEMFARLFNAAVIENSFKWHAMEPQRGHVNYSVVDQMLAWADTENVPVWAKEGDPNARLFVNDYEILTGKRVQDYAAHIWWLLDMNVPIGGIGVQGHSHGDTFDPAAVRLGMSTNRARQIESLLVDQNVTLAQAVARGMITAAEARSWTVWDQETRG